MTALKDKGNVMSRKAKSNQLKKKLSGIQLVLDFDLKSLQRCVSPCQQGNSKIWDDRNIIF